MLRVGRAEQAIDGNVEVIFIGFAGVVVFAMLCEEVRRDDVRTSSVMGC